MGFYWLIDYLIWKYGVWVSLIRVHQDCLCRPAFSHESKTINEKFLCFLSINDFVFTLNLNRMSNWYVKLSYDNLNF